MNAKLTPVTRVRQVRAELTAVRAQLAETERQRDAYKQQAATDLAEFIDLLRGSGEPPPRELATALAEHDARVISTHDAKLQPQLIAALEEAAAQVAEIDRLRMQLAEAESGRADADRVAEEHRAARDEVRAELSLAVNSRDALAMQLAEARELVNRGGMELLTACEETAQARAEVERQRTVIAGLRETLQLVAEAEASMLLMARDRWDALPGYAKEAISAVRAALAAAEGTPAPTDCARCGHSFAAHSGHTVARGYPAPTHCSQGDGCNAFVAPTKSEEQIRAALIERAIAIAGEYAPADRDRERLTERLRALAASPAPKPDEDTKRREPSCQCHLEEGDSPCSVHDRVEVVKFAPKPEGA